MFGISDVFAIIASRPKVFVIYENPTFVAKPVLTRKGMSHTKK